MLSVDRLTSVPQLESLKSRWIELHGEDERAHFFTSWEWLHACLTTERNPWMILAVREGDGPYIGLVNAFCASSEFQSSLCITSSGPRPNL